MSNIISISIPHFPTEKPIWLILIGGFRYTYPSEKSENQLGFYYYIIIFPTYWKIKKKSHGSSHHQSANPWRPKHRRASKILHQGRTCAAEKFSITKLRPRPPRRNSMEHWLWRKRKRSKRSPDSWVQGWSRGGPGEGWKLGREISPCLNKGWLDHRWSLLPNKHLHQLIKLGVDWHFRFLKGLRIQLSNCVLKLWSLRITRRTGWRNSGFTPY